MSSHEYPSSRDGVKNLDKTIARARDGAITLLSCFGIIHLGGSSMKHQDRIWLILACISLAGAVSFGVIAQDICCKHYSRRKTLESLALAGSIGLACFSYFLWNFPVIEETPWMTGSISFLLSSSFALIFLCSRYHEWFSSLGKRGWSLLFLLSAAITYLQFASIIFPMEASASEAMPEYARYTFYLFRIFLGLVTSFSAGIILHVTGGYDVLVLQGFIILHTSGFDWCHRLVEGDVNVDTWAWQIWPMAMSSVGLAVLKSKIHGTFFLKESAKFSLGLSARALLAVLFSISTSLLLLGLSAAHVLRLADGVSVSYALFAAVAVWLLASWLAWAVGTTLWQVQNSPARVLSVENKDHSDFVPLPRVDRLLPVIELRSSIVRYNDLIREANQINSALVHRNQEAALVDLANQVSHDIRSPLAALKIAIPFMKGCPDEVRTLIQDSADRIAAIANDLLRKDRQQRGLSSRDDFHRAEIEKCIQTIVSEKRITLTSSSTQIRIRTETGKNGHHATIQEKDLKSILSNILNNSIESIGAEDGTILIKSESSEVNICIDIMDDGPGFPDSILENQARDRMTLGKVDGNGIGLAAARRLITSAGGRLTLANMAPSGARVSIVLPVAARFPNRGSETAIPISPA